MLDEEGITQPDRLRLLILFLLFKDGLVPADLQKLLAHAQLPPQNAEVLHNLELLGARLARNLKDSRPLPPPLFPAKPPPTLAQEEYALSRYEPAVQSLLEAHASSSLDTITFPYTKPPLEAMDDSLQPAATSLRAAKPTWARARSNVSADNRQRVVVFMAGGATYSEARACYETGNKTQREVFLVTSHMMTPGLFLRQVGDLSRDKRELRIPADMPKPQAPRHLFERDEEPRQQQQQRSAAPQPPVHQQMPTKAMAGMNLNGGAPAPQRSNGGPAVSSSSSGGNRLTKEAPEKKEKKKHHFGFGKSKDK
jgi:syntaxin-binding protein 1